MTDNSTDLPVAVIGAGFSGTLLSIHLQRLGVPVLLLERDPNRIALGLAYGSCQPEHLLNVRVSNMSAYADDPGHFRRWLGLDEGEPANRFASRATFGRYLREQLDQACAAAPDSFQIVQAEVLGIDRLDGPALLHLADGRQVAARAVVLALGNFPPGRLAVLDGLAPPLLVDDPWSPDVTAGLGAADHVLLIGTGLTAVDVALSLDECGFAGRITAISRRGLLPHAHALAGPVVGPTQRPEALGSHLLRAVRRRSAEVGWRTAVDELRPHTQDIWRLHDAPAQARFLRHLRPWWDAHRHRLAPSVAERIETLRAAGRLEVLAGRLQSVVAARDGADVHWRPRGSDQPQKLHASRIINCTGPDGDLGRCDLPLLRTLLGRDIARADVHRLGIDTDRLGHVIGADGRPQERLFAVGPLTKGEAWEIVAVPDIRRQVRDLARYLAHTHWVGGEGL